jgi:DNA-binding CsgD family transcriptional regulator
MTFADLNARDWRHIEDQWRSLHMVAASDPETLTEAVVRGVEQLVGGERTLLVVTERDDQALDDPLNGWRKVQPLASWLETSDVALVEDYYKDFDYLDDPQTKAIFAGAGQPRVLMRPDTISDDAWKHAACRELLAQLSVGDQLAAACPVDDKHELLLVASRGRHDAEFTRRDKQRLRAFIMGIRQPSAQLVRWWKGPAPGGWTARERDVLKVLLTGSSEKEIASELALSQQYIHQVVVRIYRKLGVNSRATLMSRWLDTALE